MPVYTVSIVWILVACVCVCACVPVCACLVWIDGILLAECSLVSCMGEHVYYFEIELFAVFRGLPHASLCVSRGGLVVVVCLVVVLSCVI